MSETIWSASPRIHSTGGFTADRRSRRRRTPSAPSCSAPPGARGHPRPGADGHDVARVVVDPGAGAVHRRDEHVLELRVQRQRPGRDEKARSTERGPGLSAVVSPAAIDATNSGLAAPRPSRPSSCSGRRQGRPFPRNRTATWARRARPTRPARGHRAGTAGRCLHPGSSRPGGPGPARGRRSARRGRRPSRAPRASHRSAAGRCRRSRGGRPRAPAPPLSPNARSGCRQKRDELTLPCTKRTTSPGPAGSTPSACRTCWVSRGVRPAWRRRRAAAFGHVVSWTRSTGLAHGNDDRPFPTASRTRRRDRGHPGAARIST